MSITWIGGQPTRARLKKDLSARLADATTLLNRNKPQARQMLKQLIGERNR